MHTDFAALRYAPPGTQAAPGMDRILFLQPFEADGRMAGSFFACVYQGRQRIHVEFSEDTSAFFDVIDALIHRAAQEAGNLPGKVWVDNGNTRLMTHLQQRHGMEPDDEIFHYDSVEYHMDRADYTPRPLPPGMEMRSYEPEHLDEYLALLNEAMLFKIPHHDYLANRDLYAGMFAEFEARHAFEALWEGSGLAGLYWLDGKEVDHMAVHPRCQRRGMGGVVLSQAIARVFGNEETDHALLYAVGWNAQAQRFYRKFGMREHARHRVRYTPENP